MDDGERYLLYRAWRDAERAYRDEVNSHVDWTLTDEPASPVPPTAEAFETLARLREEAAAAQDAYRAASW